MSSPLLVALLGLSGVAAGSAAAAPSPGAESAKDRIYPTIGNGGYDVQHYDLALDYRPAAKRLSGTATITARATQDLSRFTLDYAGPAVSAVTVDGRPAPVLRVRRTRKLRITPPVPITSGAPFVVAVTYAGRPRPTSTAGPDEGFIPTRRGAVVTSEPVGAKTWFPGNDVPFDKAAYTLRMTVPRGLDVVGNGVLRSKVPGATGTTFTWVEDQPLSTYLMTANVGRFRVSTSTGPGGIPIYDAVAPAAAEQTREEGGIAAQPDILAVFSKRFGAYPFTTSGSTVFDEPALGFALENQSRPTYSSAPDASTVAHELAHQWFGDAVTLRRWSDIWLNEGFATWAQWYYDAHRKYYFPTRANLRGVLRIEDRAFWNVAPAAPRSRAELFDGAVYFRGAATLEALRGRIGDARFTTLLRRWYAEHRAAPTTTRQFTALAEEVAGRDLTPFFRAWLYAHRKPAKRFR
ncbi:M1 family metallopeptidase [Patulibacter minatonensis]|uniref:M1 family metallopeptidase n=1 Tax=Patulibacter minatonensis TaxID=298163 RepID=UPI00146F9C26|nr:M1 family metallopeptidase [Patulibacter minatonensis]